MSIVRVRFTNVDNSDDWFYFDLPIGDSDSMPIPGSPVFGYSGSFSNRADSYPMTLFEDGTIDLGVVCATRIDQSARSRLTRRRSRRASRANGFTPFRAIRTWRAE
jgi:hypothetical protein